MHRQDGPYGIPPTGSSTALGRTIDPPTSQFAVDHGAGQSLDAMVRVNDEEVR